MLNFVKFILLKLMHYKKMVLMMDKNFSLEVNNNPFSCRGRMSRLPYFITKSIIVSLMILVSYLYLAFFFVLGIDDKWLSNILFILMLLVYVVCSVFSDIKRLRDLKWSIWLSILAFIPYVCIIYCFMLIFMKSKFSSVEQNLNK